MSARDARQFGSPSKRDNSLAIEFKGEELSYLLGAPVLRHPGRFQQFIRYFDLHSIHS